MKKSLIKYYGCVLFVFFQMLLNPVLGQTLKVGDQAPTFKVDTWLKKDSNIPLKKGSIHVVEFWATWCQPCLAGVPHLSKLAKKFANKGVHVYGISVMERAHVTVDSLARFMELPVGQQMQYNVAADGASGFMRKNWLDPLGQRSIPFAVVVDKDGFIAWKGHPSSLDGVLQSMVDGKWDLEEKRAYFRNYERLTAFDGGDLVNLLNPYMGKDYAGALKVLDSLLLEDPDLLFYPRYGHFRTNALIATNPELAIDYIRKWWDESEEPSWKTVSDAMYYFSRKSSYPLTKELYLLAIEALQNQLDTYPWSMNFKDTYLEMASYYEKAGLIQKSEEMTTKANNYKAL